MAEQLEEVVQKSPYELLIDELKRFLVEYNPEADPTRERAMAQRQRAETELEKWRTGSDDCMISIGESCGSRLLEMWRPFRENQDLDKTVVSALHELCRNQAENVHRVWRENMLGEDQLSPLKFLLEERLIDAWQNNTCGEVLQTVLTQELVNSCITSYKTQGGVLENVDLQFLMKECLKEKWGDGEFSEDLQEFVAALQMKMFKALDGDVTNVDTINQETIRVILYLWVQPSRQQNRENNQIRVKLEDNKSFLFSAEAALDADTCQWIDEEAGTVIQSLIIDTNNEKYTARFLEDTVGQFLEDLFDDKYTHVQTDFLKVLNILCNDVCKEVTSGDKNDLFAILKKFAVGTLLKKWTRNKDSLDAGVKAWLEKNDCPELLKLIHQLQELCVPKLSQMIENKMTNEKLSVDALIKSLISERLDPRGAFENSDVIKKLPKKFHDALKEARETFNAMLEFINSLPEEYLVGNVPEYRKHYELACKDMPRKPLPESQCVPIKELLKQEFANKNVQARFIENIFANWDYLPHSVKSWLNNVLTKDGTAVGSYFDDWYAGAYTEINVRLPKAMGEVLAESYIKTQLGEGLREKIKIGIINGFLDDHKSPIVHFPEPLGENIESEKKEESEWDQTFYYALKEAWSEKKLDNLIAKELGTRFMHSAQERLKKGEMLKNEAIEELRECALNGALSEWQSCVYREERSDLDGAMDKFVGDVFCQFINLENNQDKLHKCIVDFVQNGEAMTWLQDDKEANENLEAIFVDHVFSEENKKQYEDELKRYAVSALYLAWVRKGRCLIENEIIKEWLKWNADRLQVYKNVYQDSLEGKYFDKFNALPAFKQEECLTSLRAIKNLNQKEQGVVVLSRLDHYSIEELQEILQDKKDIQALDLSHMDLTFEQVLTLYEAAGCPKELNISYCSTLSFDEIASLQDQCKNLETLVAMGLPQVSHALLLRTYPILEPFSHELQGLEDDVKKKMHRRLGVPFNEYKAVPVADEFTQEKTFLESVSIMIEKSTAPYDVLLDKLKNKDETAFKIFLSLPIVKKDIEDVVLAFPVDPGIKSLCEFVGQHLGEWVNGDYTQMQLASGGDEAKERRDKIVRKALEAIILFAGHKNSYDDDLKKSFLLMMRLGDEEAMIGLLLEEYTTFSELSDQRKKGVALLLTHFDCNDKRVFEALLAIYKDDVERNAPLTWPLVQSVHLTEKLFEELYECDLMKASPVAMSVAMAKFPVAEQKAKTALAKGSDEARKYAIDSFIHASGANKDYISVLYKHYDQEKNTELKEKIVFLLSIQEDAEKNYGKFFNQVAKDEMHNVYTRSRAVRYINVEVARSLMFEKSIELRSAVLRRLSKCQEKISAKELGFLKNNEFIYGYVFEYLKAHVLSCDKEMFGALCKLGTCEKSSAEILRYLLETHLNDSVFGQEFFVFFKANFDPLSPATTSLFLCALEGSPDGKKTFANSLEYLRSYARTKEIREKAKELMGHADNEYQSGRSWARGNPEVKVVYGKREFDHGQCRKSLLSPFHDVYNEAARDLKSEFHNNKYKFPLSDYKSILIGNYRKFSDASAMLTILAGLKTSEIIEALPKFDLRSAVYLSLKHASSKEEACDLVQQIKCTPEALEETLLQMKKDYGAYKLHHILSTLFSQKQLSDRVFDESYVTTSQLLDNIGTYVSSQLGDLAPLLKISTSLTKAKRFQELPELTMDATKVKDLKTLFYGLDHYANFVPDQKPTPVDIKAFTDFTRECLSFCDAKVIYFNGDENALKKDLSDVKVEKSNENNTYLRQPVVILMHNQATQKKPWGCVVVKPYSYSVDGKKYSNNNQYAYSFCDKYPGSILMHVRKLTYVNDANPFPVDLQHKDDSGWWMLYMSFMTLLTNGSKHYRTSPKPGSVDVLRYCFPAIAAKEEREEGVHLQEKAVLEKIKK